MNLQEKIWAAAIVAIAVSLGCVRHRDDSDVPAPANVSALVLQAQTNYALNRAEFFERLAAAPPATASEAAAKCVESDKAARDAYNADLLKAFAAIDNGNDSDDLDPQTAKRVFSGMAQGFRRTK